MPERNEFLRKYGTLVARVWENPDFFSELQAEPPKVLKDFGFDIPESAKVNLITREYSADDSPTTQVNLWSKGEETGEYDVIIPLKPSDTDLEDIPLHEEVLELVAGGTQSASCCPCSCCEFEEV
jgi:hypothetical protein